MTRCFHLPACLSACMHALAALAAVAARRFVVLSNRREHRSKQPAMTHAPNRGGAYAPPLRRSRARNSDEIEDRPDSVRARRAPCRRSRACPLRLVFICENSSLRSRDHPPRRTWRNNGPVCSGVQLSSYTDVLSHVAVRLPPVSRSG